MSIRVCATKEEDDEKAKVLTGLLNFYFPNLEEEVAENLILFGENRRADLMEIEMLKYRIECEKKRRS